MANRLEKLKEIKPLTNPLEKVGRAATPMLANYVDNRLASLDEPKTHYGPKEDTWDYVLSQGGKISNVLPYRDRVQYEKLVENVQDRQGFEDKLISAFYMASLTREDFTKVWDLDTQLSRYIFNKKQMSPSEVVSTAIKNEKTIDRFAKSWNRMIAETDEMPSFYEDMVNQLAVGIANTASGLKQIAAGMIGADLPPGAWTYETPGIKKGRKKAAQQLQLDAKVLWEVAKHPKLALKRDDLLSKVMGMGMQTLPYITATSVASVIAGPMGGFAVGWMVEGNSAYQTAIDDGIDPETAKAIGMDVGMIAGAIETIGGRVADSALNDVAAKILKGKLLKGAEFGISTVTEALEEATQELTAIGGESLYKDVDFDTAVKRTLASAAGGAALGGTAQLARGTFRSTRVSETRRREARLAAAQEHLREEVVKELEDNINGALKVQEEAKKATTPPVEAEAAAEGEGEITPPQIVYRGDANKGLKLPQTTEAIYFTDDIEYAKQYGDVTPYKINPSKIFDLEKDNWQEIIDAAKRVADTADTAFAEKKGAYPDWQYDLLDDIETFYQKAQKNNLVKYPATRALTDLGSKWGAEKIGIVFKEAGYDAVFDAHNEGKKAWGIFNPDIIVSRPAPAEAAAEGEVTPISLAGGEYGGVVIHPSARKEGKIQVTRFTDEGVPAGHEEYNTLEDALYDNVTDIDSPVFKPLKNVDNRLKLIKTWEKAKFGSPLSDTVKGKNFAYVSPLRPLGGVSNLDGTVIDVDNVGVVFSDKAISDEQVKHLSLVPITEQAQRASIAEYIKEKYPNFSRPAPAEAAPEVKEPTLKAKAEEQAVKIEIEPKPLNVEKDIDADELPSVTSARQAMIADDRKALGLDEMASTERKGWQKSLSNANKKGIPDRAMRIAQEVNETPRALDDEETAGLVVKAARLKNEYKNLMTEISRADDAQMKSLSAEAERIEAEFEILSKAIHLSGTEKGRALAAQKLTIDKDYSLISVRSRAKAAKGKSLTVQESQKLTEVTTQLEQANTKIEELERQINEMAAKRAVKERGIKRYTKMSLEQKDVELNQDIKRLNELIEAGCF